VTPALLLWLMLAGAAGAVCRYALDYSVSRRVRSGFPWGTAVVNLSGALALGLLAGIATQGLSATPYVVLGAGFLGAYTTFSTWLLEVVRLAQGGRWGAALVHALGSLGLGVAAAALGLWLTVR
jgi:fluoride exporter